MFVRSKLRGLLVAATLAIPVFALSSLPANAGVFLSVTVAPPALPVYVQPPLPAPGYIWTPGYWAYGDAGYYWVPGVWVSPPRAGVLWTPGLLGICGRLLRMARRLLGPPRGLLRRCELRIRLRGRRLLRW